jgi:copper(I)-binding protein
MIRSSLLLLALGCASLTAADLHLEAAWARATASHATAGGAYLTIVNDGDQPDTLTKASSDIADSVELHTHRADERGMMHMTAVDELVIPAHGRLVCRPGSYHLMLFDLTRQLRPGDRFTVTCTFARAGAIAVPVIVGEAGATEAPKP